MVRSVFVLLMLETLSGKVFSQKETSHSLHLLFGKNLIEKNLVLAYLKSFSKHQLGIGLKFHLPFSYHDDSGSLIKNNGYAEKGTLQFLGLDINYSKKFFKPEKNFLKMTPYGFCNLQISRMVRLANPYSPTWSQVIDSSGKAIPAFWYYATVNNPNFSFKSAIGLGAFFPIYGKLDMDFKFGGGLILMEEKDFFGGGRGWVMELNGPFFQIGLRYNFKSLAK